MKIMTASVLLALCSFAAIAGSNSTSQNVFPAEEVAQFSKSVEQFAAEEGAYAFLIGRVGQPKDKLPKGIQFTHTALAVYSEIELEEGEKAYGYAIHNLYQDADDPAKSLLIVDYPVDFFWGVHELKAGIIIPTPELQQKLITALNNGMNKAIHNPNYSVIANPFNTKLQNCTEHTLDLINAAVYDTTDMDRLKANAKAHFAPQRVKISRFKLAVGSLFMDDVTTRDHKGKIYTTTFSTIGQYMQDNGLMISAHVLNSNGSVTELL